VLTLALVIALIGPAQAPPRAPAPPARPPAKLPEGLEMLGSILAKGAEMGPGTGWFHPGASRLDWAWLAGRADANRDGRVTPDEWKAAPALFERLDRDADGAVTAGDLDWSPASPYLRRQAIVRQRFAQLDADSNGRVSREEFQRLYQAVARDESGLTPEDLGTLLGVTARRPAAAPAGPPPTPPPPGMMPSRWTLLKGLVSGEIGTFGEGPAVGERAPDFTLPLADAGGEGDAKPAEARVRLDDLIGEQPVILIFGSFT
jgi:hypothetical protein